MLWRKSASFNAPESWPPYPPNAETELEKAVRLEEEKEARRVSDSIDHELELEKQEMRARRRHQTRVLLLGQAESGKSTMLKNFQLHFSPEAFNAETEAWRAVIHLNLTRSVNFVLDVLSPERIQQLRGQDTLRSLRMRLSPLRQVEMLLVQRLSANDPSRSTLKVEEAAPWVYGRASEVSIRGGSGWKSLLRLRRNVNSGSRTIDTRQDELDDAQQILNACRDDIVTLWADPDAQAGLQDEGVSLQQQSGFFLDEAARVASADFVPTYQDILKARLQTIGAEEHVMSVEQSGDPAQKWVFYDVGGARGQRAGWVPYFEDVNAILFLCPVAAFNEVLLEDRSVNRLLDSFNLWKTICTSRLLASTTFILLFNKTDILREKLAAGISFSQYVRSYKDDPFDFELVCEYIKRKFVSIHKHASSQRRQLHIDFTCAIDINTTAIVITRVKEAIIMNHLISSEYV